MNEVSRHRFRVRLDDVDYVHVLYFPRQLHYFMVALEDFFRDALGLPWNAMLDEQRLCMPTVNIRVDYFHPLRFGDEAEIAITIPRFGDRSFVVHYDVTHLASGRRTCSADHTMVFVDRSDWKPIPIPPAYREALRRFHPADGAEPAPAARPR